MKKRINKKLFISLASVITSFSLIPAITFMVQDKDKSLASSETNDSTTTMDTKADSTEIIKTQRNPYNANLVSKNGPIVFWDKTISSLDWFGSKRWSLDVTTVNFNGVKPFEGTAINWRRNWVNWDIDKTNDILYVLTNAKNNSSQYVVSIDINSGKPLNYWKTQKTAGTGAGKGYKGVSVLSGGKQVSVYMRSEDSGNKFNPETELIDVTSTNHSTTLKNGNISKSGVSNLPTGVDGSFNWFFNFIPIGNNLNIVATYNFLTKGSSTSEGSDDSAQYMTAEIRFILCDNDMNLISTASDWQTDRLVVEPIKGVKNSKTMPQRDYYTLLDGRVVTVIYDTMVIIDGSNRNNPTITKYKLEPDKWIESWSFDTNENLFYKVKGSAEIKKLVLDKTGGSSHTKSSYYDLSASSEEDVKKYATNYTLYNVYGYSGQILAINSSYSGGINYADDPTDEQAKANKYGLVVAITNHKNNTEQGDTYGILNGENSILKSADFTINQSVLDSKIPSEVRRSDITFLNDGFLTTNQTKDSNGDLMYPPFTKVTIDDVNKKLTLSLYLDQIPWFVKNNVMPTDIAPLLVTHEFTFSQSIESRFQWKAIDSDYDFKNTLPTKVTIGEINNYAPLVSTLNSQNATINGTSYPKTTYSIESTNDETGEITIKAKYEYLPWEVTANAANIKSYETTKKYTIFSNKTQTTFVFAGDNTNGSNITDVSQIPELKEIKEADVLPSSFANASQKEFEKFINTELTKGYPLGKMDIIATPDDSKGELTITIDPSRYDSTLTKQTKTFTGLNKKASYSFRITDTASGFDKSTYLPSEITDDIIFKNFINSSGFDQSDFNLSKTVNDQSGTLVVTVTLKSTYSQEVLTNTDFIKDGSNWVAKKTITGFMNSDTRNKQYAIEFKEDTDDSLTDIQKYTPNTILSNINNGTGITIGGTKYTTQKQLLELFIKSRGVKIPADLSKVNDSDISLTMTADDKKGELKINLKLNNLEGKTIPVSFMHTVGGFVQGNDVTTNDTITFKSEAKLKHDNPDYFNKTATEFKDMLLADKSIVKQLLLIDPTGGYKQAIDSNTFEIEVNANDNEGIIDILLKFTPSTTITFDPKSALEVSCQYTGFVIF